MELDRTVLRIWEVATQIADGEGMEVVDVELRREGSRGGRVLRLYLDKDGGPNIDELGR
jgi:ribosome maturation factor RimP